MDNSATHSCFSGSHSSWLPNTMPVLTEWLLVPVYVGNQLALQLWRPFTDPLMQLDSLMHCSLDLFTFKYAHNSPQEVQQRSPRSQMEVSMLSKSDVHNRSLFCFQNSMWLISRVNKIKQNKIITETKSHITICPELPFSSAEKKVGFHTIPIPKRLKKGLVAGH